MNAQPIVLRRLRPYYGRISVLDTPVDEVERESGIIVPFEVDSGVKRGVIMSIDYVEEEHGSEEYIRARLAEGSVVYYRGGTKISDVTFIQSSDIIAYEDD